MDTRTDVSYEKQRTGTLTAGGNAELHLVDDLMIYLRRYAREKPESVAYACFGIGFILGWKLKPW